MIPQSLMQQFLADYKESVGGFDEETLAAYLTARVFDTVREQSYGLKLPAACSVISDRLDHDRVEIRKNGSGLVVVESESYSAVNLDDQFPLQDALVRFAEKLL